MSLTSCTATAPNLKLNKYSLGMPHVIMVIDSIAENASNNIGFFVGISIKWIKNISKKSGLGSDGVMKSNTEPSLYKTKSNI